MAEAKMPKQNEFPGNSDKSKHTKIVTGAVKRKRQSIGRKVNENFLGDDIRNVGEYILLDVVIPAMKTTITEVITSAVDRMLYGSNVPPTRRGAGSRWNDNRVHISYGSMYRDQEERRERPSTRRVRMSFHDIILDSRSDAEAVLGHLYSLLDSYGMVTVSDLYSTLGMESTFVDNKYGWESLDGSAIGRTREGYILDLPRPIQL